jgi:ubiquinone/menaquinone biosynthesis C-methylase UbiE
MDERLMQTMLDVDEHHWWYRGRRRIIRGELDRLPIPDGAQVLDAGCGSGRTLEELVDYGEVHGIELSEAAAEVARGRGCGEVQIGRLEQLPWADESFDLITCLDVLEHTPDDRRALRELLRVSKPGAWMVATVPAYQSLWSYHDEANHHFRRYERATFRAAAVGGGWHVERMTSFNTLLFPPAAIVRLAQRRQRNGSAKNDLNIGPPWLNRVLERPMGLEARWLGRGRTLPAGLSLLAVLRKPLS